MNTSKDTLQVVVDQPSEMHLAGHILAAVLRENIRRRQGSLRVSHLKPIAVQIDGMSATLLPAERQIEIRKGWTADARAGLRGTMQGFLQAATGSMVSMVLTGKVAIRGNPFALLAWKPLLLG